MKIYRLAYSEKYSLNVIAVHSLLIVSGSDSARAYDLVKKEIKNMKKNSTGNVGGKIMAHIDRLLRKKEQPYVSAWDKYSDEEKSVFREEAVLLLRSVMTEILEEEKALSQFGRNDDDKLYRCSETNMVIIERKHDGEIYEYSLYFGDGSYIDSWGTFAEAVKFANEEAKHSPNRCSFKKVN